MTSTTLVPTRQLQQAAAQFQKKNFRGALQLLTPLIRGGLNHPMIFYIRAVSLRHLGQYQAAEPAFQALIARYPSAEHCCAYAGLKADQADYEGAVQWAQRAVERTPDHVDGHYNLGRYRQKLGDFPAAREDYQCALKHQPHHAGAALGLAQTQLSMGALAAASQTLEQGLKRHPAHLALGHQWALLQLRRGDFAAAQQTLDRCLSSAPDHRSLLLTQATLWIRQGRFEQANDLYLKLIESDPTDIRAQDAYLDLCWMRGRGEAAFALYRRTVSARPGHAIALALAKHLIRADHLAEAIRVLTDYRQSGGVSPSAQAMRVHALRETGEFDAALTVAAEAPGGDALAWERAITLMCVNQGEAALQIARKLAAASPCSQKYRALLSACLKLTGRQEEYADLCDYGRLVRVVDIYRAPEEIEQIEQQLARLPRPQNAPLEQSLRQGAQTQGELFDIDNKVMVSVKNKITASVRDYFSGLGGAQPYPIIGQQGNEHYFTGSWSVSLTRGGHHISHYHSEGTVSGCLYIRVPECVRQGGEGWLKFGEPALSRWLNFEPDYLVKPRPGQLVIFPSYLWHGTRPIQGEGKRVTIAFDARGYGEKSV